jgi:hypothetical protein
MATKDLISLARAYQALQGITSVDSLLSTLITAASDAIQKYCRRDFLSTSYDELYSGNGDRKLLLRQYPLVSVESVRYRPVTVLKITNTVAANVQARVSVISTGLKLVRVNAGAKVIVTGGLDFVTNPTLTALAAAVNVIGAGWSAQIVGDSTNYGSWPSADLYWPPAFPTFSGGTSGQGALQWRRKEDAARFIIGTRWRDRQRFRPGILFLIRVRLCSSVAPSACRIASCPS